MIHPSYRNELKYLLRPESRIILSRQLERVLKRDPHAAGSGYTIRSLYFDTMDDAALRDNLLGASVREKFRIRCYNEDRSFMRLEKKVKHMNKGYKVSTCLSLSQVESILQGDYEFMKDQEDDLLLEFYARLKTELLRPCLVATYFREPFLYGPGNVRVTLDYDLRYSRDVRSFLLKDPPSFREDGKCLLEVKFDEFLPDLIPLLLAGHCPMRTANSKYVTGRFITGS